MSKPLALATNNASTTIISALNTTDTSVVVATGTGSKFPSPTGGNYFYVTLSDVAGLYEIVKCTARTADTLTIVRAQDNTAALAWLAGSYLDLRITAAAFSAAMAWAALYGEASGIAPLDASSKVATALLYVGGTNGLVQLVSSKVPVAQLPVNAANGIAGLDASTKVPNTYLYAGVANGLATLDAGGLVPSAQLPPVDLTPYYLKTGGAITGNMTISGTLGVTGQANFGTVVASAQITGTQINGVCAPTGASGGKISKVTYSTSAAGTPTVADGELWFQY